MDKNLKPYDQVITDKEVVVRVKSAIRIDIEKKKAMNIPVAVFDSKTGVVYAEYNNGKKVWLGRRIKQGNYGN